MLFNLTHSFVNIFAGGRSEIKTILFVLYLLFLFAAYLIFKKKNFKILEWKWFGLSLGIMYLYGLILHLVYTTANHISITNFFITGGNGDVSSSSLWHIHIAKATIGQILSYFGQANLQTTDAGAAYLGIFPDRIFLLGFFILSITIFQSILYFITSFKIFFKDKNKRQIIFLIITYGLLSFSLIKTSVDGGIFNRGFWLSIIFISFLVWQQNKKISDYFYYGFSLLGLLLACLYFNLNNLGIAVDAALVLLYVLVIYGTKKKINYFSWSLFLGLFLITWWVYSVADLSIYNYSSVILPSGSQAYFYNESSNQVNILTIEQTETIDQLAKKLNKNVSYLPIFAPGVNCVSRMPKFYFSATLITKEPVKKDTLTPSKDIIIKNESSQIFYNEWQTDLQVYLNPCLRETLTIVNGELIKNNINNYLLLNLTAHGTPDN
jgi:hypothetical protein